MLKIAVLLLLTNKEGRERREGGREGRKKGEEGEKKLMFSLAPIIWGQKSNTDSEKQCQKVAACSQRSQ